MKKFTYLFVIIVLALSLSLFGCEKDKGEDPNNTDDPIGAEDENEEDGVRASEDIINEFDEIIASNGKTKDIINFIDKNIKKVTSIEGDHMVVELINILEGSKEDLLDKLNELHDGHLFNLTIDSPENYFPKDKIKDIEDKKLRELVEDVIGNKYKLQASEGMYYPIVDYEKIKEYDDYVSEEIKDYVYLKSIDSNTVIAQDAALVISYDDLADIIIETEKYIERYAGGVYHEEVERMYKSKLNIYLSGLPNTPIYDEIGSKTINDDVLESYIKTGSTGDTVTSFVVGKYVNIIRDNKKIIDEKVLKKAEALVEEALTLLVSAK